MFKIDENVIFENIDECQNYFENFIEQFCENNAIMQYNACVFFKKLKNDFKVINAKNMLFIKCDDCFLIIEKHRNEYKISNYYINDDFEFIRFNISYVYNVYDLFSIIFN